MQPDPPSVPPQWRRSIPTRLLEWVCIGLTLTLVLDVLWGVVSRYVLALPSRWTDELATALLIWIALLGAALAHRESMHLGIVWLVERLDPRLARWVTRFVHLTIVAFVTVVLIYGGVLLVQDRFRSGQVLPALGWPKAWVYMAVPVAGLFMVLYSLYELFRPVAPAALPGEDVPVKAGQESATHTEGKD